MAIRHTQGAFLHGAQHGKEVNESVFSSEDGKQEAPCVQRSHSSLSVALCCLANPQKAREWTIESCKWGFHLAMAQ